MQLKINGAFDRAAFDVRKSSPRRKNRPTGHFACSLVSGEQKLGEIFKRFVSSRELLLKYGRDTIEGRGAIFVATRFY